MTDITPILDKAVAGKRLTPDDGIALMKSSNLSAIGKAANAVTQRLHPEPYRTYNIDRNINYTNICTAVCDFCAFYRGPKSDEGWVLEREELLQKIEETVALGGDQILMQGGLHHEYKLDWYEQLCRDIKERFPQVNIHGFSPPELYHFTKMNGITIEEVLTRLKAAGLGSIPGGGAEILVDRVRWNDPRKGGYRELAECYASLASNGRPLQQLTMMYGHIETLEERIEHMERVRQLQDETNGFTAFISWTFQPDNTPLSDIQPLGSYEYLKVQAISRLYLDNVPNIQSSWVTQGLKIGQLALLYGANDMGPNDRRKCGGGSRYGSLLNA